MILKLSLQGRKKPTRCCFKMCSFRSEHTPLNTASWQTSGYYGCQAVEDVLDYCNYIPHTAPEQFFVGLLFCWWTNTFTVGWRRSCVSWHPHGCHRIQGFPTEYHAVERWSVVIILNEQWFNVVLYAGICWRCNRSRARASEVFF